jgi:hypothetical protein
MRLVGGQIIPNKDIGIILVMLGKYRFFKLVPCGTIKNILENSLLLF